jgi:hypothetical protein
MPELLQQLFGSAHFVGQLLALRALNLPSYAAFMKSPIQRVLVCPKIDGLKAESGACPKVGRDIGIVELRYGSELDVSPTLGEPLLMQTT